jgi:3-hydroxyacyl-CoA dehydrogenase
MRRKIRTAAVIGSGVMGGGIAALLAAAGVKTLLLDIVPFDLKPSLNAEEGCQTHHHREFGR